MKRLSLPYQLMFLTAVVLAVYYPTQFAEISLIDDVDAIGLLLSNDHFSLKDIFIPRSAHGGYYRPLIGLSYWLDKKFWFLDERIMHFEGVIFHLINGMLIFFICREALRLYIGERQSYIPLAAALTFSLHPIATESVNWISGRTDLMMGNLVLLSALLLFLYRRKRSFPLIVLAFVAATAALLAKEAAFGWLPGLALLLGYKTPPDETLNQHTTSNCRFEMIQFAAYFVCASLSALFLRSFWLVLFISLIYLCHLILRLKILNKTESGIGEMQKRLVFLSIAFVSALLCFYILRRIVYTSDTSKIGQTLNLMGSDLNYTISMFVGAAGFYMKKFFIPLPLNFFIREIDPLYDFLGIAVLLATVRLFLSRSLPTQFVLAGMFLMLPALPFSFGSIAWTAYAERYIYLPTAFWIVALSLWSARWLQMHPKRIPISTEITIGLCILAAGVSYARNRTWLTNADLMADTVAKTPNQRKLRDIYMYALLRAGRVEEAKQQYRISREIHDIYYDDRAALIMGGQLRKEGHNQEALQLYEDALERCKYGSQRLLAAGIDLVRKMKTTGSLSDGELRDLDSREIDYNRRLLKITRSPWRLIDEGRRAMKRGSVMEASSLLDEALSKLSTNDRLYPVAMGLKVELGKVGKHE